MFSIEKKIVKNYLDLFLGEVVSRMVNFIVLIIILQSISTFEFGEYTLVFVIINVSNLIVQFGLDATSIRKLKDFNVISVILQNFLIKGSLFIFSLPIQYILITTFLKTDILIIILLIFLSTFPDIFNIGYYFRFKEKMNIISLSNILTSLTYLIFLGLFLFMNGKLPLIAILLSFLFSKFIGIAFQYFILLRFYKFETWQVNLEDMIEIIKQSFPVFLSSIMIWIYYQTDFFLIDIFQSKKEVAIYSVAYKLVLLFNIVQNIFNQSVFPGFVKENSVRKIKEMSQKYFSQFYFVSLIIIVLALLYSNLIFIFLGEDYLESIFVFDLLLFALFIIFNESVFAPLLLSKGKNNMHLMAVTSGAIVNFTLNLIIIPKYGYIGAAFSTIIAELFVFSLLLFYVFKEFSLSFKKPLIQVLIGLLLILIIYLGKYELY